jgi:protein-tyrosine phosphatase
VSSEEDPSAIPLELDPERQRLTGWTAHGNLPIDVPVISQIADDLWQGGVVNGFILPWHIQHLVSLYWVESYRVQHGISSCLSVRMYDSLEQSFEQVDAIARWVNTCRQTGPVLVHCQAGLNRSGLVVARAMILAGDVGGPFEAISRIRSKRSPACLCNPAFEEWLLSEP